MKKIGLCGGGQLALMMLPWIKKLGFSSVVLDKPGSSCDGIADTFLSGSFNSISDIDKLSNCDVVTFEIEAASVAGLESLEEKGISVLPSSKTLALIKDKGLQKSFLQQNKIPTSNFIVGKIDTIDEGQLKNKVIKLVTGGYDGKGVWIPGQSEIPSEFLQCDCVIEDRVNIKKELAVVGVRSKVGEIKIYDVVEMVMDPNLNLLDYQSSPADIVTEIAVQIKDITTKVMKLLDYVGVLAIEFFIDQDGKIFVNELSPRVHNSGHNTIESAPTGQFENHIRAIAGLSLGESTPGKESMTVNLLGTGESGRVQISKDPSLDKDIKVHLYNKSDSRPGRKMGHATFIGKKELFKNKKNEIKDKIIISGINSQE
ncbi:ATP-grasp domain-containing protein [Bacteriovoracaceae bacterium]|nr:ATP-grasp domain-containing protein [Bacteriovoracaceae bacterium]